MQARTGTVTWLWVLVGSVVLLALLALLGAWLLPWACPGCGFFMPGVFGFWGILTMMIFMLLFWGAIVGGLVLLVRWLMAERPARVGGEEDRALAVLRERYARGEITREQYQEMRRDLEAR